MNVSANTVFHFTRSYENLVGILKEEFKPRYNMEDWSDVFAGLQLYQTYVPMTCFCDIPLVAIAEHSRQYGRYAIGLTKVWARTKGLNPVFYVRKNSLASKYLKKLLVGFRKHMELAADPTFVQSFYEFDAYAKPFEGRSRNSVQKKVFYDEREWRYVPKITDGAWYGRLSEDQLEDRNYRMRSEKELDENYRLGFRPNDIRYLIVSQNTEVLDLANRIRPIKYKYDPDEQTLLITKIVSMESIEEDL